MATKTKRPQPVITEGGKAQTVVNFNGKTYNLTLHFVLYTYPDCSFEILDKVTNQDGKEVEGRWKWGTQGQLHNEGLMFDTKKTSSTYLRLETVSHWCGGNIKNSKRYLTAIVEKQPK